MFKTKEKTKTEIIIEESKSMIEFYKNEIENYKLKILKEELLIDELTTRHEVTSEIMTTLSEFLKNFEKHENHNKGKN